jgi:hypothetical protein
VQSAVDAGEHELGFGVAFHVPLFADGRNQPPTPVGEDIFE